MSAHDRLEALADQTGKPCVAVQNIAGLGEDDGALPHLLHELAIRFLGALQRVNLVAAWPPDDERIDLTFTKRLQRLLGFRQAREKRLAPLVMRLPPLVMLIDTAV